MKKIMLCCSAGMSTSLLMKKMIAEAEQRGLPVEINAYGVAEFAEQVDPGGVPVVVGLGLAAGAGGNAALGAVNQRL